MSRESLKAAFNRVLPQMGFSIRAEQYQYAMLVQDKLDLAAPTAARPAFGAIEAGTGTGKTLGYLVAVLLHIAETGERARITTHTLALQDQIYGRRALYGDYQPDFSSGDRSDMAVGLEVVYRLTGKRLTSGFRKGRQAYLSPMAVLEWAEAEKKSAFQRHGKDAALMKDLLKWASSIEAFQVRQDTAEAEAIEDLMHEMEADPMQGLIGSFMDAHEGRLPSEITVSEIGMVPGSNDNPFYQRHAGNSMDCDILVVSHALSLFDLMLGDLLPPAQIIVHDEADTMAGVAEMYARKKIRPDLLHHQLRRAFPSLKDGPVAHLDSLLSEILLWFFRTYNQHNPVDAEGVSLLERPVLEVMLDDKTVITTSALDYIRMLQEAIAAVLVLEMPENATRERLRFQALLKQVHQELIQAKKAFPSNTTFGARRLSLDTDGLPDESPKNVHMALGLTWTPIKKFPAFEVVNLYASRLFSKEWYFESAELKTVLLTSATLRTPAAAHGKAGEWDYIAKLLGMPEADGRHVSIKKFGDIARIHLMQSKVSPFLDKDKEGHTNYNPEWIAAAQIMLVDLLRTGERGLVLASSFRDVEALMEGWSEARIWWQTDSVNMHWQDGVEALRSGACQIMVTPSVWAGANIRDAHGGPLFRHLGILRAPIAPGDVVREKTLAHFFRWKGLDHGRDPDAMAKHVIRHQAEQEGKHKMTQGLGRGIRSGTDVIEIWLMDYRLGQPQWQATFPERFRGLFANPKVLHLVDTEQKVDQEMPRKATVLGLMKKAPLLPKSVDRSHPKKGDYRHG